MPTPISRAARRPPPRKLPGPEPKAIARSGYEPPGPVTHIKRTYTRERKLEVLSFLENHRIPLREDLTDLCSNRLVGDSIVEAGFRRPFLREAAAYFGIQSWGTVQTWWANRHAIWQGRRRAPKYKPRWPVLEEKLYEEFCIARESRRLIQRSWFRRRSIALFAELYPTCPDVFVFSNGWFRGFLKRSQISHRRITHASTKVPQEIVDYTNEFLQFIRRNSRVDSWRNITLMSDPAEGISFSRFPPHLIVNLDETPMPFEFLDGFTFDHKGTHSVQGKSERSGWSKRQATLVLSIVADGSYVEELKPVIIFHGKGNVLAREEGFYHPDVDVKFNDTAYNNEALFIEWIETKLAAYTERRDCLLVIDVASFHKTTTVQDTLKAHNITAALIPPGLTGYLQPLDVGFNGPFKRWLRDEADLYVDRLDQLGTSPPNGKWSLRDRRIMTTHIVAKAWQRAFSDENRSMVASLFKKTGISVHPDGREDHLIAIKGVDSSQLHLEESYRPPSLRQDYDISEVLASLDAGTDDNFVFNTEALRPVNDYRSLTVKALKEICRQRGLRLGGCKLDLICRLEDHDTNSAPRIQRQPHREGNQVLVGREVEFVDLAGTEAVQVQHQAADPVYPAIEAGVRAMASSAFELGNGGILDILEALEAHETFAEMSEEG